jgi:hypothetical protein
MMPYRSQPRANAVGSQAYETGSYDGLMPIMIVFWLSSIVRVVGGLVRREAFGAEPTLALLAIFAVPFLLCSKRRRLRKCDELFDGQ